MLDYTPDADRPILSATLAQLAHEDISKTADLTDFEQLHIFMHRLHPHPGVTSEELAMAVLSTVICERSRGRLSVFPPAITDMINFECELPWGRLDRSSVVYAKEPGISANLFIATPTTLHGPQGFSCPKNEFRSAVEYDHRKVFNASSKMEYFDTAAPTPEMQFYLGITDAALPYTAHDRDFLRTRLAIISARAARLLTLSPLAGKQASRHLIDRSGEFLDTLQKTLHIRPDRPYAPKNLVRTHTFDNLLANDSHMAAGRAGFACLPADLPDGLRRASLGEKPRGVSAHEELRCLKIIKDIDRAIEGIVDLDALKPAARKRQERKRKA